MLQRAGKRANAEQKNEVLHVYVCGSNIKHCASGTAAVVSHFFLNFFFFPFLFFALEHTLTLFRHNTHAATHTTHGFPQNRLSQIIISYSRIHVRTHTSPHTQTQKAVLILGRPLCATWGNLLSGRPVWSGFSCHPADWRWLQRPLLKVGLQWAGSAAGRRPRLRGDLSVRGRGMLHRTTVGPCQSLPGEQREQTV